ncbi:UNVERIFIED_CONTAM: hypothetical protein PYX00_004689 [Menopon gallinae]|uniref:Nuclear receptor subfamily 2 group E member 1 n=1 Tax=Menopon gallinae TaxID=328185 RepID=A0AAW2I6F4_9NEOP
MEFKADGLCKVCGDKASGKHYGVPSCDGCRGFFKRSIRRGLAYQCKESGSCVVDVTRRNQCQACRFKKCLAVNMKRDAVQHERAPRASLAASQCPSLTNARRHGFGFSSHAGFFGPAASVIDFPAYQLIYPQPTFPFQFGIKPHSLGLPHGLGLRIFNCPGPNGSIVPNFRTTEPAQTPGSSFHPFRRSEESKIIVEDRLRTPASAGSAEEDEVTSSEEARDTQTNFRTCTLPTDQNPIELPLTPGSENIYEFAAKLLFLTVKWARSIPSFLQLSFHDQSILLEDSWSDLFILSAAQWTLPIDEDYLVSMTSASVTKQQLLEKEARRLKETIARFTIMRVDHTEYACLKTLTLFKSEATGLRDRVRVEMLQDQTHIVLHDHCISQDSPKARFGKLLMLLSSVSVFSKEIIEELLFRKTIGSISIERVVIDMLKNTYNG